MSTELQKLQEKISKYNNILETLHNEQANLIKKRDRRGLSLKDGERLEIISIFLGKVSEKIVALQGLAEFESLKENLHTITDKHASHSKKRTACETLIQQLIKINQDNESKIISQFKDTDIPLDGTTIPINIDRIKAALDDHINALKEAGETEKISQFDDLLERIKYRLDLYLTPAVINKIAFIEPDELEAKKESIEILITSLKESIGYHKKQYEKENSDILLDEGLDAGLDILLNKKNNSKRNKILITVAGIAVIVGLGALLSQCSTNTNDNQNNENNDLEPEQTPGIEQTYEDSNKDTFTVLQEKGFSDYAISLMLKYFDQNTIDTLLSEPYNKAVEYYVAVTGFKYEYLNDYENARETYGFEPKEAVEFINRDRDNIVGLTEKGYSKDVILAILDNFDKNTIKSLLAIPYNEAIKDYVAVKDFNIDYLDDYENARTTQELSPEEAVQLVNKNKNAISLLTEKGYSEHAASLMASNFKDTTIDSIINGPHNPMLENYVTVNENEMDFNLDYINDYEIIRTIYNITPTKAVDLVNRAHKISETGFYNDAEIADIVEVLIALDDKEIFMGENVALSQSINATLTEIYNNYAFGTVTEADITKIEAFNYFAKEGTDLDLFLTEYGKLVKNVLNTQADKEKGDQAKEAMYKYLDTFANTFAGNKYDIENVNENAVVSDTFDWNTAYTTFIKPLISMYITDENVELYVCVQINMQSNYEQWAVLNGCNLEGQSLGGE